MKRARRHGERGFALLVVFLFAAAVAFTFYRQLPRAAFESVRDKEQILIDRGGQYKRAIEVFYAVNKRYPASLEDLEKSDKRYLRHRYKDPLTGKDEWRIIHTNGTFLTDSLVQKPPAQNGNNNGILAGAGPLGANSMNTANPATTGLAAAGFGTGTNPGSGQTTGIGQNNNGSVGNGPLPFAGGSTGNTGAPGQPPAVNAAVLRRPSDRIANVANPAAANQDGNSPDSFNSGFGNNQPVNFNDPNSLPPITLLPTQQGASGQNPGQQVAGQPTVPGLLVGQPQNQAQGQPFPGTQPAQPGSLPFATPSPFGGTQPGQIINPQAALGQAFGRPGQQPPGQPAPDQQPSAQSQDPIFGAQNGNLQSAFPQNQNSPQPGIPGQFAGQGGFNPQPAFVPNPTPGLNNPTNQIPDFQPNPAFNNQGAQITPLANPNPQPSTFAPGPFPTAPQPGLTRPAQGLVDTQLRTPASASNAIQPAANNLGSPGVAGVASTFEGPSIKSYAKREKYQEWEFVFDPATAARTGQQPGQPGQNPQQQNPSPLGQPSPSNQPPSPFGGPNPFAPAQNTTPGR